MNKRWTVLLVIILGLTMAVIAAQAQERGPRDGREGPGRGRVVFGVITSISAAQITVEPRLPDELADRLAEAGWSLPEPPDDAVLAIDDSTEFYLDGAQATAAGFAVGDEVVVAVRLGDGDTRIAARIADPATARDHLRQRMMDGGGPGGRSGRGGGSWGEGGGMGPAGGPGREGGMGPGGAEGRRPGRPVFGEITAINGDSWTIRFELPDFIQRKLDERGIELPADLPSEVTITVDDRTRFVQNGEPVADNPFGIGDLVAVMGSHGADSGVAARAVSDWATVEERMAEFGAEPGPGRGGPGGGRGRNRGE